MDDSQTAELVDAYDVFIESLSDEISQKLNDLEDAKAASTDMVSKRSYTKRFNKMN